MCFYEDGNQLTEPITCSVYHTICTGGASWLVIFFAALDAIGFVDVMLYHVHFCTLSSVFDLTTSDHYRQKGMHLLYYFQHEKHGCWLLVLHYFFLLPFIVTSRNEIRKANLKLGLLQSCSSTRRLQIHQGRHQVHIL